MGAEYEKNYVKRLEAALLEYVEKYGPTPAAKAVFRDEPEVTRPTDNATCSPERRPTQGEEPTD